MTNEYMVDKIREWAKNGVISRDFEVERLIVYGVTPDAAKVMAAEDTLYYEADH